jgi:hypothetical protein
MPFLAFFLSPIGRWLALGAVVAALWAGNSLYFYKKGETNVQTKWDAATQAAIDRGTKAHDDAVRDVGNESVDGLRHDKFDRD